MTGETLQRTEWANSNPILTEYYDSEWGMPVISESGLFERLALESFQSGLSWLTILKRREGFREAFMNFDVEKVAALGNDDVEQLMQDTRIIRNRRKIVSTVLNAKAIIALRDNTPGGFPALVWSYMPQASPTTQHGEELPTTSTESHALAKTLKTHGFSMVGPTTMFALMAAIGMVDLHIQGSHRRGCSGFWDTDGSRTDIKPVLSEG